MKILLPEERLIVAADFKPGPSDGKKWVRQQVLTLTDSLIGTGVYLKLNSALRACGYDLIREIKQRGLRVFADLKLYDIGGTLATDGTLLKGYKPELLTTVCSVGEKGLVALKATLPNTEVLGVTVLTSLGPRDVSLIHGHLTVNEAVMDLAEIALQAGLDGLIASAAEASQLRKLVGDTMTINTPGIRPTWAIVPGDDQHPERIMTPFKAIEAGATRIVVGRPITRATNPYDAVMRTLEEIESALA
jgi:orotidine-5'-phosphate decarboxylase